MAFLLNTPLALVSQHKTMQWDSTVLTKPRAQLALLLWSEKSERARLIYVQIFALQFTTLSPIAATPRIGQLNENFARQIL